MGLLDIFGGGSGPKKVQKIKTKALQRYGDASVRQRALGQLAEMQTPEALEALLSRLTVNVEPQTNDRYEKEYVFESLKELGTTAVEPARRFLRQNDKASSWIVRFLDAVLSPEEATGAVVEHLEQIGPTYSRDPEKKVVLLQYLVDREDPRIAPAVVPFLEDPSDEVKIAALRVLGKHPVESAREPLLALLTDEETARRVQTAGLNSLLESGLGVQGFREKVEALLPDDWFVDRAGVVKRRGADASS